MVSEQFPQFAHLSIRLVDKNGWDNRTFHLGEEMSVRFPRAQRYAAQVEKEQFWLTKLQPFLPQQIPRPIGLGKPSIDYPWQWSIYRWIKGDTVTAIKASNMLTIAAELAYFLKALHSIKLKEGPQPGLHNFYRGGSLSIYHNETQQALNLLRNDIDTKIVSKIWEAGVSTTWKKSPVWIHGDISPDNLLTQKNQLCAVIDFGLLAVGDPACDLAIAWKFFDHKSRQVFKDILAFDDETWTRGRAWALWKVLVISANISQTNAVDTSVARQAIDKIIEDYERHQ